MMLILRQLHQKEKDNSKADGNTCAACNMILFTTQYTSRRRGDALRYIIKGFQPKIKNLRKFSLLFRIVFKFIKDFFP